MALFQQNFVCSAAVTHPIFSSLHSYLKCPHTIPYTFPLSFLSLCKPYLPLAGVHFRISRQFYALEAHWRLQSCYFVVTVTTLLKNWVQLAVLGYCSSTCLSTLPLLDIAPLANGVWTTVNDPDALQLPGKMVGHSSFCVTLPGHDMIFIHGLWEGLWSLRWET